MALSRAAIHVRDAVPEDTGSLMTIWGDHARRHGRPEEPAEAETARVVARMAGDPDERLLVAELGGRVIGGVHLRRAPLSPICADGAIHVSHLQVLDLFRRHGVGRALIEAAVSWAEEKDTQHVLASASVNSRDANRFMARLGLGQLAVVRGATTAAMRAKLPVEPVVARIHRHSHRPIGQVLAQRRSMRRSQT